MSFVRAMLDEGVQRMGARGVKRRASVWRLRRARQLSGNLDDSLLCRDARSYSKCAALGFVVSGCPWHLGNAAAQQR
jgi:hypothetical protein